MAPVGGRHFPGAAPVPGRHWPRHLADTRRSPSRRSPPSSLWSFAPADPEEAVDARGVGPGGAALSGGVGGPERGHGDRCGPALWGGPPDGAPVVAQLRRSRPAGVGGPGVTAAVVPAPDAGGGGGAHRGDVAGLTRGGGPRTILYWLEREGPTPLPGRTSVERCLVRHGLVTPQARKRKRSDYKRWERSRAMELWQMDVVGGVRLLDAPRPRSSRASMTTPASWSVLGWWHGPRPGRCGATPWPMPCGHMACPRRSSLTTPRCSPPASAPAPGRWPSTGSVWTTGSATSSPPRPRPPPPARWSAAQDAAPRVPRRQRLRRHRRRSSAAGPLGGPLQPPAPARVDRADAPLRAVQVGRRRGCAGHAGRNHGFGP